MAPGIYAVLRSAGRAPEYNIASQSMWESDFHTFPILYWVNSGDGERAVQVQDIVYANSQRAVNESVSALGIPEVPWATVSGPPLCRGCLAAGALACEHTRPLRLHTLSRFRTAR
jgi:hypothetical protein